MFKMTKRNNSLVLNEKIIDVEYIIPESFKLSVPKYFKSVYKVFEENSINNNFFYPIIAYAVFYDKSKNIYDNHYDDNFMLKSYFNSTLLPIIANDNYILNSNNNFLEEFFKNDGFVNSKEFFQNIKYMKSKGYGDVKISIGIWTDDGILQEKIVDLNIDDYSNIALALTNTEIESYNIYNNSPEVVRLEISKIFANDEISLSDSNPDLAKMFITDLFNSKGDEEKLNNDFYNNLNTVFYENCNLFLHLNKEGKGILRTIISVDGYDFLFVDFLIIVGVLFHSYEDDQYKKPTELNNKDYDINSFSLKSSIFIKHKLSDYGNKLVNS